MTGVEFNCIWPHKITAYGEDLGEHVLNMRCIDED